MLSRLHWLKASEKITSLFWSTKCQRGLAPMSPCDELYVDQQTLKQDDDCVLPHRRLWTFDVLVCLLSGTVTERFLLQPLVCGTVFQVPSHVTAPPLSIFYCRLKSHLFLLSYIPLSDSLSCTVSAKWLVMLDTIMVVSYDKLLSHTYIHDRHQNVQLAEGVNTRQIVSNSNPAALKNF